MKLTAKDHEAIDVIVKALSSRGKGQFYFGYDAFGKTNDCRWSWRLTNTDECLALVRIFYPAKDYKISLNQGLEKGWVLFIYEVQQLHLYRKTPQLAIIHALANALEAKREKEEKEKKL